MEYFLAGIILGPLLIVWLLLSAIIALVAYYKGDGFLVTFAASVFFSPLLMALVVAIRKPNTRMLEERRLAREERRLAREEHLLSCTHKRCPECREIIDDREQWCPECNAVQPDVAIPDAAHR